MKNFETLYGSVKIANFCLVYQAYQELYSEIVEIIRQKFPDCKIHIFKSLTPETVRELQKEELWQTDSPEVNSICVSWMISAHKSHQNWICFLR